MKNFFLLLFLFSLSSVHAGTPPRTASTPPIYISFLWHMHQPIYWPGESVVQTDANARYSYSVTDIHNQRIGPYTSWPKDAVQKGIADAMPNFGAQVSFSGSLMENLNALEANGDQNFSSWKSSWNSIVTQTTSLGNPRIDLVQFGYYHPLMALLDTRDVKKQIEMQQQMRLSNFSGSLSKGIFPPENAFSERMIPALVDEGIQWVLVDNIHFERACEGYPYNTGGNLIEPNKADIQNPNPNDWVQLNGVWAPTQVSARWAHQPHYAQYVDPATGQIMKMIVVPADRYLGNEDGRGGFGALNYDAVMSQFESDNTDPQHPILIVLAHDGDNYGGGTDSYYGSNFQNFVNWLQQNPSRFVCTTVQDYLKTFPPDSSDVIHVEDGSWSGADNGDPEFKKWNGDPDASGYSPDRNSWGVITAAKNYVFTADQISSTNSNTTSAWKFLLNGEASDYWYWDGSQGGIWDAHPTRAANQAVQYAKQVVTSGSDNTGPTIFLPQRLVYNPGATQWGIMQPKTLSVWTYVFDVSGLKNVTLNYRTMVDSTQTNITTENETYAGGSNVTAWNNVVMNGSVMPSHTTPLPTVKAEEYTAIVDSLHNILADYFVEAEDSSGNISRSPIRHVWIGNGTGSGTASAAVHWTPASPTNNDTITITIAHAAQQAALHWGINYSGSTWQKPDSVYWISETQLFGGTGPAVESPFSGPDTSGALTIKIGPFNNPKEIVHSLAFVIHYNNNTWDNNSGQDYHINFGDTSSVSSSFVMDGVLDVSAKKIASNNGMDLYAGWNGSDLYVATQSAQSAGGDVFIFVSDSLRPLVKAPWAKSGKAAQWSVLLGNESTNNWSGWFDAGENGITLSNKAGAILEGTVNLKSFFGKIPPLMYIGAARYQTSDGGTLLAQVPSGNGDGNVDASEFFAFNYQLTSVGDEHVRPLRFALDQNFPNPFNPATQLRFTIAGVRFVTLKVYDVLGREVASLVNERKSPGTYEVNFDGSALPSGVYFYRLEAGSFIETKKFVLLK